MLFKKNTLKSNLKIKQLKEGEIHLPWSHDHISVLGGNVGEHVVSRFPDTVVCIITTLLQIELVSESTVGLKMKLFGFYIDQRVSPGTVYYYCQYFTVYFKFQLQYSL